MNRLQFIIDVMQELGFDFEKEKEQYVFTKELNNHFVITIYKLDTAGYFVLKITDRYDQNMILSKRFHFIACSDEEFEQWFIDVKNFIILFDKLFCKTK